MHSTLPACRARRAFTLIELLTVIAIIGILAAIIIPTVGKVRATARNAQCVSRLRDWGGAIHLYANDNKGKYRIANWLSASSNPYQSYFPQGSVVQNVRFFGGCPLLNQVPTDNNMSYGMIWPSKDGVIGTLDGGTDVTLSKARSPSRFLMMADTMIGSSPRVRANEIDEYMGPLLGRPNPGARGGDTVAKRHGETKINGLFGDGSVKSISGTPAGSGDTNSIYEMRTTWFQLY